MKYLEEKHLYRFGTFTLNPEENVLSRDDEVVSLTPKMFEMLHVLIRNHGQVVDKDTLFREVWPDSFVEEGNISFNIRQLRKLLDDNAQSPIYIETVPRRGYRFIAEVEKVREAPDVTTNGTENLTKRFENREPVPVKSSFHPFTVVFVLFVCFVGVGLIYLVVNRGKGPLPVLARPFASEKLSMGGNVFGAAISPDGKTVAYSVKSGYKQSIWLRQIDTGTNVPFIPPADEYFVDFNFAPDGNSIYFSRSSSDIGNPDIYRLSIRGGIPEKVVSIAGAHSLSPDGKKIVFVRCPRQPSEWCSLWMADSKDGGNEKRLLSHAEPERISDAAFSPDGRKIVYAVGQSRNAANEFRLAEFDLAAGTERAFSNERFFNIKNLAWLPDQSGVLVTASRIPNKYFRIWNVSAATGESEPLTKDSEAYSILSIDGPGENLISTQIKQDFKLFRFEDNNPTSKQFLADGVRPVFASDGKLYYSSIMSGNDEIWSADADGSNPRQLTSDLAGEGSPIVSRDNKAVYFSSNRSGEAQIWKMNTDGSGQIQITKGGGTLPYFVASDGKTLYYGHAFQGSLRAVSLETGEEKIILDIPRRKLAFSPDGSQIAFLDKNGEEVTLTIIDLPGGAISKTFPVPRGKPRELDLAWQPDGKSINYLISEPDYAKGLVYRQDVAGGPPKLVLDLKDEELSEAAGLAVAPDGRSIVLVLGGWRHDAVLLKGLK